MNALPAFFRDMSLQRKLIMTYSVMIFIPLVVLGSFAFIQSRILLEKRAYQGIETQLKTFESHLSYKLDHYQSIEDIIIFNSTTQKILTNNYIDYINLSQDLRGTMDPLFNIILLSNKEMEQMTIYSRKKISNYGDYLIYAPPEKTELWDLASHLRPNEVKWYIDKKQNRVIAIRVIPETASTSDLGILYIGLSIKKFFGGLEQMANHQGCLEIIDEDGQVLYANSVARNNTNVDKYQLMMERKMSTSGWTIKYGVSPNVVLNETESILYTMFLIIGICIVMLIILGWIFTKTLVRPILYLHSKMNMVKNGDLTVQIRSTAKDEMGLLTNQFAEMLVKINELIHEVYVVQIQKRKAQLTALQAQINPHFLYNTLSTINWKALYLGSEEISRIVITLARFYRKALNQGDSIISVRDELEIVKAYIDIQLIMHDNSFEVEFEIDEDIYSYETLNLLLQPIVENAIEHGIYHRRKEGGKLRLTGVVVDERIEISVEDNGPGMDIEAIERLQLRKGNGYGIFNIRERIQLFFGPNYGVRIESEPMVGTKMTIVIPAYRQNKSNAHPLE
ncbi:sensor histidine kinase [Paenibacillus sp. XY044]|uniref:sensor histidine kinase n=1 Tax=Paenibacillus sp. XY044 TaxID=2026089 RepID=UPI000B97FAA4|nr:sensor histidine kinase [Paenibacillus sp. XY044]OZB96519.1 hypothetical protein CJP46_11580 [Paenibacillus sp. XY044]